MTTLSNNRARYERIARRLRAVGATPSLLILFILMIYPMGTLLLLVAFPHAFDMTPSFRFSLSAFSGTFSDPGNASAIVNSLLFGVLSALLASILGVITAIGLARTRGIARTILRVSIWVVFFAPSYIIAQGWVILMQDNGILAQLFHMPNGFSGWFFSPTGLVVVMGFRYFPFVHFAVEQAIANIGGELVDAARLSGGKPARVLRSVILPLLLPALLAGTSIAFAEGFGDFGFAAAITPQMQIPLLSYQIYAALSQAPVNFPAAAVLSLVLLVVTGMALWLQFFILSRRGFATISTSQRPSVRMAGGKLWVVLAYGIALGSLILPMGATLCAALWKNMTSGIASNNWTFQHFNHALITGGGMAALGNSVAYALISGFAAAGLGLLISFQMSFVKTALNRVLSIIIIGSIAVPGVVMAAGFVLAWNGVWLIPLHLVLYGTPVCLSLAYIAGSLPYSIRLQMGALSQVSVNLLRAAQVLGAKRLRLLRVIVFPLIRGTVLSTWLLAFIGTFFELPASSLLYPPGQPPFPVLIAAKFNAFLWSQGSALTLLGMTILIAVYGLGQLIVRIRAWRIRTWRVALRVEKRVSSMRVEGS